MNPKQPEFTLLILVLLLTFTDSLFSQIVDNYAFTNKPDTIQNSYLLNRLNAQFEKREKEFNESLQSPEKFFERQSELKQWYKEKAGALPAKTDLNISITKKQKLNGYSVEWVSFESRPGFHVTGLFYTPEKGTAPYPAVYIPCGHAFNGKASEKYQRAARLFALNGFAVLQADPVCQGERLQYLDDSGKAITEERMLMHEILGQQLLLTGSNTLLIELWDNIRCVDFLEQHPLVDKNRIVVAGNSGGGTQATYLTAFDERIKVAVVSCYLSTTESKLKTRGSQDGCQQLWGEGEIGIEEQDFLLMAAPKPVLISSATEDFFRLDGAKEAFNEMKKAYSLLGVPAKVSQVIADGPHGWHKPLREAAVLWCKKWLTNDSSVVTEPEDIGYFSDAECLVTKSSQVLTEYENEKSVADIINNRLKVSKTNREKFLSSAGKEDLIAAVKKLTGYENPANNPAYNAAGSFTKGELVFEKILIEREPGSGFYLPSLLITPENKGADNNAVIFTGDFKDKDSIPENSILSSELKRGHVVLILDVCNTGELKDGRKPHYDNEEFFIAKLPLYEGKSLLAYRMEDIIIAKRYLQNKLHPKKMGIAADGITIPAAIHAAFIDDGFDKIKILDKYLNWEEIASSRYAPNQLGNIIPAVLNYYDLPDLLKYLYPKMK